MVLNSDQNDRFFDTIDPLLYYVNDRFRVVEGLSLESATPLDDVKISLVANMLWENVEIIDDFVRDNPARLPRECLDLARSWKNALPGYYTLVRYQQGRALLMNEAGVFSVCGVTNELEQEIGPAPAYVEIVLLPFEDTIVYDGFVQAYDIGNQASDLQRIQDEFENRCAKGIALTGADFAVRAEAYLAERREQELEALLDDVARESQQGDAPLPEGVHRGVLAGLPEDERQKRIMDRLRDKAQGLMSDRKEFERRVHKREAVHALEDCLMLGTKGSLEVFARQLGISGLSRLRKAEMVAELAEELPQDVMALTSALLSAPNPSYQLARTLSRGEEVHFSREQIAEYYFTWPIEPYVYLFGGKGGYTALIPDELKPTFATVDFDYIDKFRHQQEQAMRLAEACAAVHGVAAVDDAYDQYRALAKEPLDKSAFFDVLEYSLDGFPGYDLWTYEPHEYITHYTLSSDFLVREFTQTQRQAYSGIMRNSDTGELSRDTLARILGDMRADLASELEWLEQYKRSMVESQSNLPMKPLPAACLEADIFDSLKADPSVVRLRDYLDAHVPDDEDDYTFADRIVENVVLSAIESGDLQGIYDYLLGLGLDNCFSQGSTFWLLVNNVFNAMPSWENNGWSPQELYEQVTGRKVFYNDDGTVMRVGADEACPCGSGKKYRDCCGR
ncbi:MAG TPA: hypothetical protein DCP91_06085 [Eggerthellaceae bacterium]|nr:hypothetical protein [Eggerthellaceae bacterium]